MTKKEIRAEWVRMLRSGEFKQGRGSLRTNNNKFCCLGVLCEFAVAQGVIEAPFSVRGRGASAYRYGFDWQVLPREVQQWVGLQAPQGIFKVPETEVGNCSLSARNDRGATFEEIADLIEAEPAGLFLEEVA